MQFMLNYLANMPDVHKILWLAICLSSASLLELVMPLSNAHYRRWRHAGTNLILLLTTFVINAIFSLLLVKLVPMLAANKIGVLYWVSLPVWVELLVTLVVLDLLAQYTIHYLLHRNNSLQRLDYQHVKLLLSLNLLPLH